AGPAGAPGLAGEAGPVGATGATGAKGEPGASSDGPWADVTDPGVEGAPTVVGDGLAATEPIESSVVMGEAVYAVAFDRDVSACAAVVSRTSALGERSGSAGSDPVLLSDTDAEAGGSAYTYHDAKRPTRIRVRLLDAAGRGDQGSFALTLRCPST
ncbi:MAG: hypothetical protein Q7T55_08635, partial [Solirubrobacteraceae bacterium]|nr:hypothetical protein [Solirubrobacteraceae bacterium]